MLSQPSECACYSGQGLVANAQNGVGPQREQRASLAQIKAMRGKARVTSCIGAGQQETFVAALGGGALGKERGQDLLLAVVSPAGQIQKPALPNDEVVGRDFLNK